MAYSASGLTLWTMNGVGPKLWNYSTSDTIATVNSSGYFNDAANMLNVRDVICVSDTNAPTTHWVNVLSNTGSVVDVSDGTVIVETDGD